MNTPLKIRIWDTVKNAALALPIGILDIFAGYIVTYMLALMTDTPQLLIIYPMLLTARGNLNGILTGNISTQLHLGTIKPSFRGNTREFYSLIVAITILSILTGLYIGLIPILNIFTIETTYTEIILTLLSALNTLALATYLNIPLAIYIAGKAFKSALDPDIILYPVMSTLSDIIVSLLFTLTSIGIYLLLTTYPILLIPTTLAILLPTAILTLKYGFTPESGKMIRETLPLISILILISWGTGNILSSLLDTIVQYPIILVVFPSFATLMGDIGSIIGSITTTKLYLGELKPKIKSILELTPEILGTELIAIFVLFMATGLSAILTLTPIPTLISIFLKLLAAQLILISILTFLTTGVAFITFTRGLNADNFVIPVETTVMDLLTILTILIILTLT